MLAGEPAAAEVESELRREGGDARITAVSPAEVIDQLVRRVGFSSAAVGCSVERLLAGKVSVMAVDESVGRRAAAIRPRRHHRGTAAGSLADCVALAAAIAVGAAGWRRPTQPWPPSPAARTWM